MKQRKIWFWHTFLILIELCGIFVAAPRVSAAQASDASTPEQYGITVNIVFTDSLDRSDELSFYQANAFILEDMDGCYALAEYSEKEESYIVNDFTSSRNDATRFYCGCIISRPSELSILGLPKGDYLLTHISTQDGWQLLSDSIEVSISEAGAVVGRHEIELSHTKSADGIVAFEITIPQALELPLHGFCWDCWFYRRFGFVPLPLTGIILMLGSGILFFLWRKSRKKA